MNDHGYAGHAPSRSCWLGGVLCAALAGVAEAQPVPIGDQFQLNSRIAGFQSNPSTVAVRDGFLTVWSSADDGQSLIVLQQQDFGGRPVGAEVQVNELTQGARGFPDAAASALVGSAVVVWAGDGRCCEEGFQDGSLQAIHARRMFVDGTPVGPVFEVNQIGANQQQRPAVAMDGSGGFFVVWESFGNSVLNPFPDKGWAIRGRRYRLDGVPRPADLIKDEAKGVSEPGDEFEVNTFTTGAQQRPAVASNFFGTTLVAWQSEGSPGNDDQGLSIQARCFGSTGSPGVQFQVNTTIAGAQSRPAVVFGRSRAVVAWESLEPSATSTQSMIRAQVLDSSCSPVGSEIEVNTSIGLFPGNPRVAIDLADNFVVIWEDAFANPDSSEILAQSFDRDGHRIGGEIRVNQALGFTSTVPTVGVSPQGLLFAVWESDGSLHGDDDRTSIQGRSLQPILEDTMDRPPDAFDLVGNLIWVDENQDGLRDAGEPLYPLRGLVELRDQTGAVVDVTFYTPWAAGYAFTGVPSGNYRLFFRIAPDALTVKDQGMDDELDSDAAPGTYLTDLFAHVAGTVDVSRDAGVVSARGPAIGNFVWEDLDEDGIQDGGEPGVGNVEVRLFTSSGALAGETVTTDQGFYEFLDPEQGEYYIEMRLPPGYAATRLDQGLDDGKDSDLDPVSLRTAAFLYFQGTVDDTRDAGLVPPLFADGFEDR
ncbi:SdrD B-like domain-containing protein [Pseudomarimonas salicorniae]|uniref:SD-repeat containing protein B domain-containing protein n=1 Tax=Pseudomarimonas salicorniae TaxID=2933270 RepID=A0ABT0GCA6_9GAMM|nr:SdrD B-like domain-containing protein [Lysobacter sp. CAU 1642]MCK7592176.1 hypothetical protein [Lysobacter sp. CAU 1642]